MMEDEKLSVRINLADRIYPLRIARQNEEKLRKAARMINESLNQYKDYTERDIQDMLAISALQFVIKLIDAEEQKELSYLERDLEDLDIELGTYLSEIEN